MKKNFILQLMDYVFEDKKREPLYKLMDGVFTKKRK